MKEESDTGLQIVVAVQLLFVAQTEMFSVKRISWLNLFPQVIYTLIPATDSPVLSKPYNTKEIIDTVADHLYKKDGSLCSAAQT